MITIKTDRKYRNLLSWGELTPKEQKEFDWMQSSDTVTPEDADFIRYRNWVYYLGDFERVTHPELKDWDGFTCDTFFSGVVVKYNPEDSDQVMIGTFYS